MRVLALAGRVGNGSLRGEVNVVPALHQLPHTPLLPQVTPCVVVNVVLVLVE
jgi:hypothetical protein